MLVFDGPARSSRVLARIETVFTRQPARGGAEGRPLRVIGLLREHVSAVSRLRCGKMDL